MRKLQVLRSPLLQPAHLNLPSSDLFVVTLILDAHTSGRLQRDFETLTSQWTPIMNDWSE
jgi:hypothetical protein